MIPLTQIGQYGPISRYGIQRRLFQRGSIFLEESSGFFESIATKTPVHDKGARRLGGFQKLCRAFIRRNHALLNQML